MVAVIRGVHAMFYTPAADELRTFIRDKLRFPFTDTGGGWLIFNAPAAEIACHPHDKKFHGISFHCDDLRKTMEELKSRGVEFTTGVTEEEWGSVTRFRIPGGDEVDLFQPKYATHHARRKRSTRSTGRKRARRKR